MNRKLKLVLALTQDAASRFSAILRDYSKFFDKSQGAFLGYKNTYMPQDAAVDDPSKRGYSKVVTTVDEKIDYLIRATSDYIQNVLTKERTNGSGFAKADLIVNGENWGEFYSNELLALKSILEKSELSQMIQTIPVRTETDIWEPSTSAEYVGREIYQKPLVTQEIKTTVKTQYILSDPNLDKLKPGSDYKPQITTKDDVLKLGVQTRQEFSGQWTHSQRAAALDRLTTLKTAVSIALEKANDVDAVESPIDSNKIFGFIFQK